MFLLQILYSLTRLEVFSPAAAARRARYRQVFFELEHMSARELDELGIRRCDIARIARESVAG
jgi:uncharacterized protein YjiS (DUF1127 family)